MKLVIDIGNTRAKVLIFNNEGIVEKHYCDSETLSILDDVIQRYSFSGGIISSVGRIGNDAEKRLQNLHFPMTQLCSTTPLPQEIKYKPLGSSTCIEMPSTMGADRIAALVGATAMFPRTPLLIIDAGTCVTYEVIDNEGCYRGGNIAPGLTMRLRAMHEQTALLPLVESIGEITPLGTSTETAMLNGATLGLQYEIEGYIMYWTNIYPDIRIILTSGNNLSLAPSIEERVTREDNLVAYGLYQFIR